MQFIVIPIVTLRCSRCVMPLSYSISMRQRPKNISFSQEKDKNIINSIYKIVLKSLNFKYQTWSRSQSLNQSLHFNPPFVSNLLYLFLAEIDKAMETTLMSFCFCFLFVKTPSLMLHPLKCPCEHWSNVITTLKHPIGRLMCPKNMAFLNHTSYSKLSYIKTKP